MWKAAVHQRGTATVVVPWQRLLGVALTPPHRQVCLVFKRVYLVNSTASGVRRWSGCVCHGRVGRGARR